MSETPAVIDTETFTETANTASTVAKEPSLNAAQISTLFAEIRAIETRAVRAAILAADNTCLMRKRLDAAIQLGQVSKDLLNDLSSLLCAQENTVLTAIAASNLSQRIEFDLAPQI